MREWVRELLDRRDLLYMITWRDIRIKYKQSVMGFLWALLMPLVIVGAGVLVRYAFARLADRPLLVADIGAVTLKAAPWAFFVSGIRFATMSLVSNTTLVTKIYMPRAVFPIAAVLSQLADFAVAAVVVTVILAAAGIGASAHLLWVPPLIAILVVLVAATGILCSAAALFFRDVKYLVEVVLTFAIFFTPVFYEASMLGPWEPYLLLNPVAPVLEALTTTVVHHHAPDLRWLGYAAAVATLGLVLAGTVFRRLEPYFAESV